MKFTLQQLLIAVAVLCILFACWNALPSCQFVYKQRVDIVGGFYAGQSGKVIDNYMFNRYKVLIDKGYSSDCRTISGRHLKAQVDAIQNN